MIYDTIIIGAGAAGITAAIYCLRSDMSCLLLESKAAGGQITQTVLVENYTGIPSMSGIELAEMMTKHLEQQGGKILYHAAKSVDLSGDIKTVSTDHDTFRCRTVIFANGLRRRLLNVDGEKELTGRGVSYCAICDGAFFKGKTVAVAGNGNSALEDSLYLADVAGHVYLINRENDFNGQAVLINKVLSCPNITILYDTTVTKICGSDRVEYIELCEGGNSDNSKADRLDVDGLFVAIGLEPDNELYHNQLETDDLGFIRAGEDCCTSMAGVFAAGDCRTKHLHQIITSAADGAVAAGNALLYIQSMEKEPALQA